MGGGRGRFGRGGRWEGGRGRLIECDLRVVGPAFRRSGELWSCPVLYCCVVLDVTGEEQCW